MDSAVRKIFGEEDEALPDSTTENETKVSNLPDAAVDAKNLDDASHKVENPPVADLPANLGVAAQTVASDTNFVASEEPPPTVAAVTESEDGSDGVAKKKRKRMDLTNEGSDKPDGGAKFSGSGKSVRALRQQARALSYDENLLDAIIQNQLGTELKGKRKKPLDFDKNKEKEAMIAACIGFPKDSLTEEEIEAGVIQTIGDVEQDNYIEVRNHIIARWRENVHIWLDQDQIMESIRSQHKILVTAAYKFLSSYGYINFGVAPAIKAMIPEDSTKSTVIIIGAGLAGLAAARQLLKFGHRVAVIEGRNRPGGRVYTRKMEGGGQIAAADLGGSVITGLHGNPLGVLARQLSIPLHKIREKCPLYQPNGSPLLADVDAKVEAQFNKLLDRASQFREQMGSIAEGISLGQTLETLREDAGVAEVLAERQLFDWHLANLEYANAGLLSDLSLAFWDQDDPYEMGGDHCFLLGGNVRLVSALAEGVPIFYGKQVHTIRYSSNGVQVITHNNQVFEGDMALCTVPLGVLKKKRIKFEPELPQRKLDAIQRLGFGLLNKVAMLFPRVFWGSDLDTFGHLAESTDRRGEFFLFYSYAAVSGGPLLLALVAGEAAINFESMFPTDSIQRVLKILRGIYEPQGITVPDPIQTVCTRWGGDPLCFGSYSHVAVGASGDDYDLLAESVGDGRLFFAGEATIRRYPATMHGALLSGLREAGNIAAQAANRLPITKVERVIPKDTQEYAMLLSDLFREPDLEFGSFSILFDPRSTELKSHVLLRVMIGMGAKKKVNDSSTAEQPQPQRILFQQLQMHQQQQLHLYTVISRQQALELMEVKGGDKMRLGFLCETLGVKLVGRRGLGALGDSLVSAIKTGQAARKPAISSPVLNGASNLKLPKQQAFSDESRQQ